MKGHIAALSAGVAAMLALGGCTPVRIAGFDSLAAQGELDRIDVTHVPGWRDGTFRVGAATGHLRRRESSDAIGWGPDIIGPAADAVRIGSVARFGTVEFAIDRLDPVGRLEGRCRYFRSEARGQAFGVDAAAPLDPLQLGCAYRIDGRDAGSLVMRATSARDMADPRTGTVTIDGLTLDIESTHRLGGVGFRVPDAIGYVLLTNGGETAGAVEMTGAQDRRMLLSRQPALRAAATAALLTLALFPDPGNVD
ncbi:hypothetical protein SAMN05192583_1431 [Sphingomonas gellani]|uniref:Lipoprotein n=1 Tax=Sphingomonas gellani TaxID=1166340 RepID=A0A1H8C516_9SPHN|nr:hypothetical protein [Sphingomonas gellani]SEM89358.1 hypothetical protein SAMN05192583_1431 [Sphingomonas gellani]